MLSRLLLLFLLACSVTHGKAFPYGTPVKAVQSELGRAESTMEFGSKEILIYADGTRLEFSDGKLVKENDRVLAFPKEPIQQTDHTTDPLIEAEDIIQPREEATIGASAQTKDVDYSSLSENYGNSNTLESLEADLQAEQRSAALNHADSPRQRLRKIALAFGIEILVTFAVLSIAFQISGFPVIFRQLILLSLAVALIGALLHTLLYAGPLNPIRSAAGFFILLALIRQLTDVREWATAIKISMIARIVSIGFIWLAMVGLSGLFSM